MSIAFILEADDVFAGLLISPEVRKRILACQSDSIEHTENSIQEGRDWKLHRIIVATFIALVFVGIFFPEKIGVLFADTEKAKTKDCGSVLLGVFATILIGGLVSLSFDVFEVLFRSSDEFLNRRAAYKAKEVLLRVGGYMKFAWGYLRTFGAYHNCFEFQRCYNQFCFVICRCCHSGTVVIFLGIEV